MQRHAHSLSRTGSRTTVLARVGLAGLLLSLCVPAAGAQQDPSAPVAGASAQEPLRAVFIDLAGKVQWRASDKDAWQDAKVNDSVAAGVEVRTGLRSHAAIRMRNATVLLDAGTMFQLPQAVQDGEVLRTTAAVKHGRADFKVDKVGLSNDFKVVTPSTTLAVRGTEFAVATGALKQVEVIGARRNAINAIELKYALNNSTVQLSGGASSSSGVNHPAHVAAVSASPPAVSAAAVPSVTQTEAVQAATGGEAPTSAGSASQVQSASRSTRKSEKAREVTGTPAASSGSGSGSGSGSSSIAAQIRERIERANRALDQSIAYLLQAEDGVGDVELRRDAIGRLKELASLRRDEARAALVAHQDLLESAREIRSGAEQREGSFNARADGLRGTFESFDGTFASAGDSLDALRAIFQAAQSAPVDDGAAGEIAQALRDALAALGTLNSSAIAQGALLRQDRDAIVAAVNGLRDEERVLAAAAVNAYDAALAELVGHVESGASEYELAEAARDAVAGLKSLVDGLADEVGTAQVLAKADEALARLQSAADGLASALAALDSVRAARAAIADDARAAELGEVEAIYQGLVALRVRVLAEWSGVSAGITARSGDYRTVLQESADLLALVGDRYRQRGDIADSVAEASTSQAGSRRDDALEALGAFDSQLASAEDRESGVLGAEQRFDEGAARLEAHIGDFDQHHEASLQLIAAILEIARGGEGGGETGGPTGGHTGGQEATQGFMAGETGGPTGLGELVEQLREALLALGDSRDGAAEEYGVVVLESGEISSLVDSLAANERAEAAAAAAAYQEALTDLNSLLSSGASRAEASQAAGEAVDRLRALVDAIESGASSGAAIPAARTALLRLELAAEGFERSVAALAAISSARAEAADDERAAMLADVEALYERVLAVRTRVLEDAVALGLAFDDLEVRFDEALLDAEDALGAAGQEYAARTLALADGAGELKLLAEDQVVAAQDASDERSLAADHAEEFESFALAVGRVEDLAAESVAGLDALGTSGALGGGGIAGVLASLNALDEALIAVVAQATDPNTDLGDRLEGLSVGSLAARAEDALTGLIGAKASAEGAADGARALADLADPVAADAARLAEVAAELKVRFGISDSLASAASAVVARLAESAASSADAAAAARGVVDGLRLAAESDRLSAALARLEALVDARGWDSSGGLDLLARAESAHAAANEHGATTFGGFVASSRAAMDPVFAAGTASGESLQQMASLSGQMVTALDGAETAAGEAERLRDEAFQFRVLADGHELNSAVGLARTGSAIDDGDLAGAAEQSSLTAGFAAAAQAAADGAADSAVGAKAQATLAVGFAADVNRVSGDVLAFGNNRNQFVAAAASRRAEVEDASEQATALRDDVAFFDEVVQQLSDRAGTPEASRVAGESATSRAQAIAIATQLSAVAASAAALEQTASTNAGRLFGRSVSQYVGRAQAAANAAEVQSTLAAAAAARAAGNASSAAGLVNGSSNSLAQR